MNFWYIAEKIGIMKCTLFFRLWKFFLPSWGPKCFYFTVVNVRLNSLVVSPSWHVFQVDTQYLSSHLWVWEGGGNSLLLLFLKQGMSAWIHLCLFFSTCVPGGHTMFFLSLSDSHFCEWVSLTNFNECFFCCYCMWVVHTVIFLASSLPCLVHGFAEGLKTAAPNEFFGSKLLLCLGTMS
jgi:hypothetical protein